MNGIQSLNPNETSFGGLKKGKNAGKASKKILNAVKNGISSSTKKVAENAAKDDKFVKANKLIAEEAAKEVNGELPKGLKGICKFLSDNDGEVQNQIINAIFTTTLAPLMIWKNPFSKKSEQQGIYKSRQESPLATSHKPQ